jgi:hypothetical protein
MNGHLRDHKFVKCSGGSGRMNLHAHCSNTQD